MPTSGSSRKRSSWASAPRARTFGPAGARAARIPLGDIGRDLSPYPFLLILGQDENERLLGEALRGRGIGVEWNTELVDLAQTSAGVSAKLRLADGSMREIETKWVAGCDGAHSAVRHLTGIDFPGAPYEHVFFVADTVVTGSMVPDELNVYLWRDGFHLFFPMRGTNHWRLVGIVPPDLRARDDLSFDALLPSLRKEAGSGLSFESCSWFSMYRISHRRAARFRDRRCFLLGDAAHIHSPVGAQGMNTGLQDAYNLGVEARARRLRTRRHAAPRLLRARTHPGRGAVAQDDRPGLFHRRVQTGGRRGCFARRSYRG